MFASGLLNDLIFNMLFLWHDYIHCPNFTLNSFQKLGLSKPVGGIPCDVATMCGLNPPPHPSPPTVCAREAARACLSACTSCRMLASPVPFLTGFWRDVQENDTSSCSISIFIMTTLCMSAWIMILWQLAKNATPTHDAHIDEHVTPTMATPTILGVETSCFVAQG